MKLAELMRAAKAAQGWESDYRLAAELGISRSAVSQWRNGHKGPSDAQALRLAELAGLDGGAVLAWMAAERARSSRERSAWTDAARRLASAAAAAVVGVAVLGAALPLPADATPAGSVYYVKWAVLAALVALAGALARNRRPR